MLNNSIWSSQLNYQFPVRYIGKQSIHNDSAKGICSGSQCNLTSHYSNLQLKNNRIRKYKNYKRQFGLRMMTVDRKLMKTYRNTELIRMAVNLVQEELQRKIERVDFLVNKHQKLRRAFCMHHSFNRYYNWTNASTIHQNNRKCTSDEI
jgi:hypothetical protein